MRPQLTEEVKSCLKNKKTEKEVKKTKRLASEQAMELHDLIEDACQMLTVNCWYCASHL